MQHIICTQPSDITGSLKFQTKLLNKLVSNYININVSDDVRRRAMKWCTEELCVVICNTWVIMQRDIYFVSVRYRNKY